MNGLTERFSRQTILKGFGHETQQRLHESSVLVIGLGGLGCPIVEYLSAMGIGRLGIADNDIISLSNLNRQIIYSENQVGQSKADQVAEIIKRKNSKIIIETYKDRWDQQHCVDFFPNYDIIVDGTDNFATRYMINDACVLLDKPLIYGAVSEFEGQVAVFNVKMSNKERSCNYRDLFPIPPQNDEIQNCSERGVLGVLPGIIGCMQALETIKVLTDIGNPLINKILTYNGLNLDSYIVEIDPNSDSKSMIPENIDVFLETDYQLQCFTNNLNEINWNEAIELIDKKNAILVDVRESHELPRIKNIEHLCITMKELTLNPSKFNRENIIFLCQSGKRSLNAINILQQHGLNATMFSIKGGIQSIQSLW